MAKAGVTELVSAYLYSIYPEVADVFTLKKELNASPNTVRSALLRLTHQGKAQRARPGWYRGVKA